LNKTQKGKEARMKDKREEYDIERHRQEKKRNNKRSIERNKEKREFSGKESV
jgi:hypothetical protein